MIGPNYAVSEDLDHLDPQDLEDPADYRPFYDDIDTIRGEMEDIKVILRCEWQKLRISRLIVLVMIILQYLPI